MLTLTVRRELDIAIGLRRYVEEFWAGPSKVESRTTHGSLKRTHRQRDP
jgi:hypothetical protein